MNRLARLVCQALEADACAVRRLNGENLVLLGCHGIPEEYQTVNLDARYGIGRHIISNRVPIAITDAAEHPLTAPYVALRTGFEFTSYMGAPMLVGEEMVGIVGVFQKATREFGEVDLTHMTILATTLGTALRNREMYQELNALNDSLEERVERRTNDLRALGDELEELTYAAAHDLRQPVRGILGSVRICLEDEGHDLKPQIRSVLQRTVTSAQRLSSMIDDMLALARIVRAPLRRVKIDLSALAEYVCTEIRAQGWDHEIAFVVEPEMEADGDQGMVAQVLGNLIENAVKYHQPGEPSVVTIGSTNTSYGRAIFVRDNGIGFDPAYATQAFRAFERLVSADVAGGNGVGLAGVKRIVERHGGRVWVQTAPMAGATFFFTLGEPVTARGKRASRPRGRNAAGLFPP
jgi:signal transduction histidine kinase